jgi:hypothetical protein
VVTLDVEQCRSYGLSSAAAGVEGVLIPYRHTNGHTAFERLRLIHDEDLARFGGGKYRQPAGCGLLLYDPFAVLDEPLQGLLLVEGELNALSVRAALPSYAVIGLPGQRALKEDLARQLGHLQQVCLWIDRHDPGADANARAIARRLRDAGIEEFARSARRRGWTRTRLYASWERINSGPS